MIRNKLLSLSTAIAFAGAGTACGGALADVVVPQSEPGSGFWGLQLNHTAINLALTPPYNTIQLAVTPFNEYGEPLPVWTGKPVFTILDTEKLSVDSNGVLTALGTGSSVLVIGSLQVNGVTRIDTAWVRIVAAPPASPLSTLSIQSADPRIRVGESVTLRPVARSVAGGNLTGLQIAYRSSNKKILTVNNSGVTNASLDAVGVTGKVWIVASTYAFGVQRPDSIQYRTLQSLLRVVDVEHLLGGSVAFWPATVKISQGGSIIWRDVDNRFLQTNGPGIIFANPSVALEYDLGPGLAARLGRPEFALEVGDIPSRTSFTIGLGLSVLGWRRFEETGTYTYSDDKGSNTASIVVVAEEE